MTVRAPGLVVLALGFITLWLGVSVPASAQPAPPPPEVAPRVDIVPRLGIASTWWGGEDGRDVEARTGTVAGVGVRFGPRVGSSIAVEGAYMRRGVNAPRAAFIADYVDLGLTGRLLVPSSQTGSMGAFAGPWVGIPLGSEARGVEGPDFEISTNLELGFAIGIEGNAGPVVLEARYIVSDSQAIRGGEGLGTRGREPRVQNQALSLSLGVRLGTR